jgi:hypothetical protein
MTGLMTFVFASSLMAAVIMVPRARLTLISDRIIDCSDVVERVLAKSGGRLLSVRPHGDRCTVTVLVHEDGKRPEKIVVRVDGKDAAAEVSDQD